MIETTFFQGFGLGFSLIMAIGAQNAFVLRTGLDGRHVFIICLFCAVSDAALIALGVGGVGAFLGRWEGLEFWLYLIAAIWLIVYGGLRLREAFRGGAALSLEGSETKPLWPALSMIAGLTWLNPHVYLDTIVLLGGISAPLPVMQKWSFGLGATLSSFVFFFGLGYGAKALSPWLRTSKIWRRIDILIALIMFWIALGLIIAAFRA
jgi:L-lysine exporter family protein LysE/ArgO